MTQLVKYAELSLDDLDQAERQMSAGSSTFLKLAEGRTVLRILPARLGEKAMLVSFNHYINVPGQNAITSNCSQRMANKPCPICQQAAKLEASPSRLDNERAKEFFPRLRVYANVIDRAHPESGPQVFAFGKSIYEPLAAFRKEAGVDFTHPVEGFDIIVVRKGMSANNTKYKVIVNPKGATPLGNDEWIDQQKDLRRYTKIPTFDEVMKQFGGGGSAEDLDEVSYTPPAKQIQAKPTRTAQDDALSSLDDDDELTEEA